MTKHPYPTEVAPVPHLCGDIAKVMRLIRRHTPVGHPDRKAALDLCRTIQQGAHQLRFNSGELLDR